MRRIYMDHNATTAVHPEVVEAMLPFFGERFGNPSSVHSFGQDARQVLEDARKTVASALGARKEEIVFTSGGTEADNLAVLGVAAALCSKGRHIVTSKIEHHAVLAACAHLGRIGFEITEVPCDEKGIVDPDAVTKEIRKDTVLITIMHANNEVGTIQPIEEIAAVAAQNRVVFHTDAVQSFGKVPLDVSRLNCNLLSVSSHKIYGPKGVGALYVKRGTPLAPILYGGHHEKRRRAGTENLSGVVGFARAAELATADIDAKNQELLALRTRLEQGIVARVANVRVNAHPTRRLPSTVNVCFEGVEGESIVLSLDMQGIAVSSGSACTSGSIEPSHVLLAMGIPPDVAQGSVRFSLGLANTDADVDRVLDVLPGVIERLRAMSPLS
ncbi:MAG: cysteine desulfurase NifS [Candidatus Eisenbacteria bacterium]